MFRPHPELWNSGDGDEVGDATEPVINKLSNHEPEFTSRQIADIKARRKRKRANVAAGKSIRRNRSRRGG